MPEDDGGVLDSVEEGGLDQSVLGHVEKRDSVADLERAVEGVIADDIPGETGAAAETI